MWLFEKKATVWLMVSSSCMCACSLVQSCLTLCNPMNYSPPGSSGHRILQARILEWVATSFSKGSSWFRDWTCVCCISSIGRQILSLLTEPLGKPSFALVIGIFFFFWKWQFFSFKEIFFFLMVFEFRNTGLHASIHGWSDGRFC